MENIKKKILHHAKKDWLLYSVVSLFLAVAFIFAVDRLLYEVRTEDRQETLDPFYTPPDPLPQASPGDIIRKEPLDIDIPSGGSGYRILYMSERSDGSPVVSSGMVFFPSDDVQNATRPVVAWSHPTVGMGRQCAPSRSENPLSDMSWLEEMLSRGWVVTATDYAGLGTPGTEHYLIGRDEARDLLNSVRAAHRIDGAAAGTNFALWGHSQGGHAVLFAAMEAKGYMPELNLIAVATAAPAAEMTALISEQYRSEAGWVIGPEVLISWPEVYTDLNIQKVATSTALKKYEDYAYECIAHAGENAITREILKESFFEIDPVSVKPWYDASVKETPDFLPPSIPLFIAQGLDDKVVLPSTTALYVQRSCQAGSNLTTMWLGGTNHLSSGKVAGPSVVFWLDDRFNGKPANPTCDQIMPVQATEVPIAPTSLD